MRPPRNSADHMARGDCLKNHEWLNRRVRVDRQSECQDRGDGKSGRALK